MNKTAAGKALITTAPPAPITSVVAATPLALNDPSAEMPKTDRPEPSRRSEGTTFSKALTPLTRVDIATEGVSTIMHRPIGVVLPHLTKTFTLTDWGGFNLDNVVRQLPWRRSSEDGSVHAFFDERRRALVIEGRGTDRKRTERGLDVLSIVVSRTPSGEVGEIGIQKGPFGQSLSRTTLSLILSSAGFYDAFPALAHKLREQLVLEQFSPDLRERERLAYRPFPLNSLEGKLASGDPRGALPDIMDLVYSKSLEIRRYGSACLEHLHNQRLVDLETYIQTREALFTEDVREDMVFIERTLRNDRRFVSGLLGSLRGGAGAADAAIPGTQVDISYFARGCNKQIYTVDFTFPDRARLRCAISSIRDAQLGQSDFDADRINAALDAWQELSSSGCAAMVKFGAATWHYEWRPRQLLMHNGILEVIRLMANEILLVGREFVADAVPGNVLLHEAPNAAERRKISEQMAEAYWQIWHQRNVGDQGIFFTTPRAEDIVFSKATDKFTVVDPDTLVTGISKARARDYFQGYDYYSSAMLERAFKATAPKH